MLEVTEKAAVELKKHLKEEEKFVRIYVSGVG